MERRTDDIRKIIIKVGSSSLCDESGAINKEKILNIISQIATLKRRGYTIVLVSSGAIAAGMGMMGLSEKPQTLPKKQALAAIGQARLMEIYEELFAIYGMRCAQILLNHDDFDDRLRLNNMFQTMNALIDYDVVPVINENDALAVDEIKVGDNDTLAALLMPVAEAQLLILASDIDGLYTANPSTDPEAELIPYVAKVTPKIMSCAGDAGSSLGTGGMATKLKAAKIVNAYGAHMCIVNAGKPGAIAGALEDEGTWFNGREKGKLNARAHWIAYRAKPKGTLTVDDGCAAAVKRHASVLAKGIVDVDGQFMNGAVVLINDQSGQTLARGAVNYASDEIRLIKGHDSKDIMDILHYKDYDEIIHANNMVVLREEK